jgi:catechol 2,3-dioxygenase-like lactoylglutathione lyase family enzyme
LAVRNAERNMDFYRRILGFRLGATWHDGACLSLGGPVPRHSLRRHALLRLNEQPDR